MKIAVAQINPFKADIQKNIELHIKCIRIAGANKTDLIAFPELSLSSYEPSLSNQLAIKENDKQIDVFKKLSEELKICIALGLVSKKNSENYISMAFFQPQQERSFYSKQLLHDDEKPYFRPGNEQIIFKLSEKKIAPAICYESMQNHHAKNTKRLGAEIYIACVAKNQEGIDKAFLHYPAIASRHGMTVLMCNNIGFNDNFCSAGQSAIWNSKGELMGKLESTEQALLVLDTELSQVIKIGIEA